MSSYVILTDSACDIVPETLAEWGVKSISLTFRFNDEDKEYDNDGMPSADFYNRMRNGSVAKTSAINSERFRLFFEQELKEGNDVLYLGFSSGLSATYSCGRRAAEELQAEYPEQKILTVDSLSASAGFGLLLYLTLQKKQAGATIEEAAQFAEQTRMHLCHWFTVDDLVYLKRGGRISPTVALVGGVLGIKPVLHMDDEGHLISVSKVRGRKAALKALSDKFGELAVDRTGPVYISHGDCIEDARYLENLVKEKYGVKEVYTYYTGAVIGSHSGPGTLALFFLGSKR